jgi:tripartite-type tricarboxylate transporter receptor subunit TctC
MRSITRCALAALFLAAAPIAGAAAQVWPSKPVKFLVPSAPGDGSDIVARAVGQKLHERLGQPFVVENKPGAGGIIGTDAAKNAAPDGYTFIVGNAGSHGINAAVYSKLPYDPLRDFEPVTMVNRSPNVCVINHGVPAASLTEFVDLARKEPGKYQFASGGNGSSAHLTVEYLKLSAQIDLLHVAYRGATPALTDVVAGHVHLFCGNLPPTMPFIRNGQVRALGITTLQRNAELPDVPTIAESGYPGFETVAWFGLFAPKGTPAAIVSKLQAETAEVLKIAEVRQRLASLGSEPVGDTPADFRRFVEGEIDKWTKVARAANVKLD